MDNWYNSGQWTELNSQQMKYPIAQMCRWINTIERHVQRKTRVYGDPILVTNNTPPVGPPTPMPIVDKRGNVIREILSEKQEYTTWLTSSHIFPTASNFDGITFLPISNFYTGPKGPVGSWPIYGGSGLPIRNISGAIIREARPVCLLDILWKIQNWCSTWFPTGVDGADCPWINRQDWTIPVMTPGGLRYSVNAIQSTVDGYELGASNHAIPVDQCFGSKIRFLKPAAYQPYASEILWEQTTQVAEFTANPYNYFAQGVGTWELKHVLNRAMWQQLQNTFVGLSGLSQSVESWLPYSITSNSGVKVGDLAGTSSGAWASAKAAGAGGPCTSNTQSPSCATYHAGAYQNGTQTSIVLSGVHKVRLPEYFPENTTPRFLLKMAYLIARNTLEPVSFKEDEDRVLTIDASGSGNQLIRTNLIFERNNLTPENERTFTTSWNGGVPDDSPFEVGTSTVEAAKYGGNMALIHDAETLLDNAIDLDVDLLIPGEEWEEKTPNLTV